MHVGKKVVALVDTNTVRSIDCSYIVQHGVRCNACSKHRRVLTAISYRKMHRERITVTVIQVAALLITHSLKMKKLFTLGISMTASEAANQK